MRNLFLPLLLLFLATAHAQSYCDTGYDSCEDSCIPSGYTCCSGGAGCAPGTRCDGGGCCPIGKSCTGPGGTITDLGLPSPTSDIYASDDYNSYSPSVPTEAGSSSGGGASDARARDVGFAAQQAVLGAGLVAVLAL